ncbi:hypothetical protein [Lysobacter soli]|uniref:hypothetical protein n=1 Tax=Lysobacter soli TaxID=453783 RepID=UPI0011C03C3B|nr:hypothetical protein [Lysobacter soli]
MSVVVKTRHADGSNFHRCAEPLIPVCKYSEIDVTIVVDKLQAKAPSRGIPAVGFNHVVREPVMSKQTDQPDVRVLRGFHAQSSSLGRNRTSGWASKTNVFPRTGIPAGWAPDRMRRVTEEPEAPQFEGRASA